MDDTFIDTTLKMRQQVKALEKELKDAMEKMKGMFGRASAPPKIRLRLL
jgi:hypothetical protein